MASTLDGGELEIVFFFT